VFGIHKADPERLDPRTKSGTGIDPLSATGDVIMDTGEIGTLTQTLKTDTQH